MGKTTIAILTLVFVGGLSGYLGAAEPTSPQAVDIAICLDTSNSMDGLIDSAKRKLWAVVSELATAKPHPRLRVALYQYGNDGLDRRTGWVQQVCELTDDLDKINDKLFSLKTNGGTEYVARVIRDATNELKWSPDKNAIKMIFVAGNEPATQDLDVHLQDSCKAAATKGIVVNTVFCGSEQEGRSTGWSEAAGWADGRYAAIDQDHGTIVVNTKFDKEIDKLNKELNKTYVAYGAKGEEGKANQVKQDANTAKLGAPAGAERAAAKATPAYTNAGWDLVDASKKADFDLKKVAQKDLPKEMQAMPAAKQQEYLDSMKAKRTEIQKQIADLNVQRNADIQKQMAAGGLSDKNSFDNALRQTVRAQAAKSGMKFEDAPPATQPANPPATQPAK